jgi:cellulose synthase/poly-beta-1,6-N-acetylglucosamine synthase-like glycosyltransferase
MGANVPLERDTHWWRGRRLTSLTTIVIVLVALVCIAVSLPGPWIMLGTLLIGLSITVRRSASGQTLLTILLCLTVGATAVDYLTWRLEVTNWDGWWIAAPLLAAEIFGALHTVGLQYTVWPWSQPKLTLSEDPTLRPIFIFIPTVNEGQAVLAPTIHAAIEARRRYLETYPHGCVFIVVCNDGRVANAGDWAETESLARRLGVTCVTRTVGGGAKAGNLEHARQQVQATGAALLVIFDADQVAKPDFLLKTVPPFADPTIGWVQTGQYYSNLEHPVARWANDQQALFYRTLCPGKAAHNAAFICGTNVVIRAAALDQIGGLPQDSVTEDFAASIELHPTWRSIFLTDVLATGLGPMDLPAYLKQQRRWAIGTIGVLRSHWPAIFLPRRHGLSVSQRIQYALACTHYLCGLRDLIYLVAPIAFLITGVPAVRGATLGLFLWHFLPYWIVAQAAFWHAGRRETGLRGIIIGFGSFPVLLQALFTVALGRRIGFMVTSKQRRATRAWTHLVVYLLAVLACVGGIVVAFTVKQSRVDSVVISVIWVLYDIALLTSFLWLGVRDLRYQEVSVRRSRASLPVAGRFKPKLSAATLSGLMAISAVQLISDRPPIVQPVYFTANQVGAHSPYLGLSLRFESLLTRPPLLEEQLCLPFTIIGRTQDIHDSFDFVWAEQLLAHQQRPWITLQFGQFDANGKPPLDAGLPAIANGAQDANIQRWAQEIRTFGKPLYLTILLHVDRNWSVSSAVANGGIPQDAPRAWEHVQSIFKATGDTNVAWVWAPADPANDATYAPPESMIDVALQSMIRYPDTPWPDPGAVLRAVTARHPTKPLFVEVSASGPPEERAAWLKHIVATVKAYPNVYALLYHEGAPNLHPTVVSDHQWSLESDQPSLDAAREWRALIPTEKLPC